MNAPRKSGAPIVVAYQGTAGAYSHLAARRHFGADERPVACVGYETFRGALEAVANEEADFALLPVENTTAGSVVAVYDLLAGMGLPLVGEEVLKVEHCLVTAAPGPLGQIRRVLSHPQALAQCSAFLASLPDCEARLHADTAMAAEKIQRDADPAQAAIASREAARRYGLHVMQEGIANQEENYTRFVAVARAPLALAQEGGPFKTSLVFATPHAKGALVRSLMAFEAHGVNLAKLESRPRPGRPWEYLFFVDIEGHAEAPPVAAALRELEERALLLTVFGSYPAYAVSESGEAASS